MASPVYPLWPLAFHECRCNKISNPSKRLQRLRIRTARPKAETVSRPSIKLSEFKVNGFSLLTMQGAKFTILLTHRSASESRHPYPLCAGSLFFCLNSDNKKHGRVPDSLPCFSYDPSTISHMAVASSRGFFCLTRGDFKMPNPPPVRRLTIEQWQRVSDLPLTLPVKPSKLDEGNLIKAPVRPGRRPLLTVKEAVQEGRFKLLQNRTRKGQCAECYEKPEPPYYRWRRKRDRQETNVYLCEGCYQRLTAGPDSGLFP